MKVPAGAQGEPKTAAEKTQKKRMGPIQKQSGSVTGRGPDTKAKIAAERTRQPSADAMPGAAGGTLPIPAVHPESGLVGKKIAAAAAAALAAVLVREWLPLRQAAAAAALCCSHCTSSGSDRQGGRTRRRGAVGWLADARALLCLQQLAPVYAGPPAGEAPGAPVGPPTGTKPCRAGVGVGERL